MNQMAPLKLPPRRPSRADQEFLPAALEILETPPSPISMSFLLAICALVAALLAWSYFGRIDIFAIATGKILPVGQIKTIQPLETARVRAFTVKNGQHVEAGAILIELDPTETFADEAAATAVLASYRAEALRRHTAIESVRAGKSEAATPDWPSEIPVEIRARETRVLDNDLRQLAASLRNFEAQRSQKSAERSRLVKTIESEKRLIDTLRQRVDMRTTLEASKNGSKASLIDATETLQYQETALATQEGQLAEAEAGLAVIESDMAKTRDSFISDNSQKLADAERQIDDYRQRLAKAQAKTEHMTLRSPIAGTVQGLTVTTIGQVLVVGQEAMKIVPDDTPLEIEAYLENKDIGFVREGQDAIIKIESFPFTRYGTLNGRVTHVARDSIPAPDAQKVEGDPTQASKAQSSFVPPKQTQNLVYAATIKPDVTVMRADGVEVPLSAGMSVSVEIKTGRRRILEYIFSPLVEVASEAMRER